MLAAVVRGDPAEVRSYIEDEGFDVNEANAGAHGNTPLMVACAPSEKLGVLSLLLDCKHLAKDAVNRRGMTALHQAAWYGQERAVEMLLRAGAETSIKTPAGLTAADIAQQMGNNGTLKLLTAEHARKIQQQHSEESAEQLRARIKAQYCRVRENSCRRQISAPRPLPQTTIKCEGDTGSGSRPVLPHASPHRRTAKVTEKCGSISTTPQAVRRAPTCSAPDINQHAPRWLPSGASTARARAEREDVAMLPESNCASTYKSNARSGQYPGTETTDAKEDQRDADKERVSAGVEEGDAYVFLDVVGAVENAADTGNHGCASRERNVSQNAAFFLTELGV